MLISKLVGVRLKDNPADAIIKSHALLMRAGFIKFVANGIWTLGMPAKRIASKIEKIIREEMDAVEGQECTFPVVMPRELWDESGRYSSVGEELLRFTDRNNRDLVLGMTHEEAAVHFARDNVSSYQQLPFMIYQIQTKFRDEARSRGGLIRLREFTMKDAYSFHMTQQDLSQYYDRIYRAYNRIFERIGLKNVITVNSDSGMMGGSVSCEYILLTPVGEDTIAICPKCGYKANIEVADARIESSRDKTSKVSSEVFTGDAKEISEVCKYLGVSANKTIKAVIYNIKGEQSIVVCFIRGDLDVNEAKLKKAISKDVVPATIADGSNIIAGNIGPINLKVENAQIIYDRSVKGTNNMIIGANKPKYHITGIDTERDLEIKEYFDITRVKDGMKCVCCGSEITVNGGIELGHIFQLGDKYSKAMDMTVLDQDGCSVVPIMGCYGIGISRAIASVAEEMADEKGLVWPISIAPWSVYLCPIRFDDKNVAEKASALYNDLKTSGIDVLFDDRNSTPGCKFADCDLMGIPIRVVVSPRTLANGCVEIQMRDGSLKENFPLSDCVEKIQEIIAAKKG
jgi:prolyl-tRNA synthetase